MKQKSTFAWLYDFAAGHRATYALSVVLAAISVAAAILPYFLIGQMITALLDGVTDKAYYLTEFEMMALSWLINVLAHHISTALSHKATFALIANIRLQACEKLYRMPLGYVLDTPSGSLKNIIVERIDSIETTMAHVLPEFTSSILEPIAVLIYLFVIDWRMALATLICVPLGILAYMGMFQGYEESWSNAITKTKKLNNAAVEYINGIEVIKAFGNAESSYEKFVTAAKEGASCYVDWMRRCLIYQSAMLALLPATLLGVLPVGGLLYRVGTLSANDFIMVIILSLGLIAPLITMAGYFDDLAKVGVIVGEIVQILDGEEMKRPDVSTAKPQNSEITLDGVTFAYHEKEVLHGIHMTVRAGTVNALVGPSGSGKSTIAKLIAGLWDAKGGTIRIGGVDVTQLSLSDQNAMIAYVSQDSYLFDLSVMENIRLGKPNATDEQVIDAAKRSGCYDFIMHLEKGFDTICGGGGGHLSGGERQRISIARAMLKDADIVILDEATAYTDPENEAIIQSAVARLVAGKTLLVIAHRLSTIADSDCIFVVKDGTIEASGTQDKLLASCPLYRQMWESHISVKEEEVAANA